MTAPGDIVFMPISSHEAGDGLSFNQPGFFRTIVQPEAFEMHGHLKAFLFTSLFLTAASCSFLSEARAEDPLEKAQQTFSLKEKEAYLSEAIAASPSGPSLYMLRAEVRREAGDLNGAWEDLVKAVSFAESPSVRTGLLQKKAALAVRMGDLDAALTDYTRAIELSKESSPYLLSQLYTERGRVRERLGDGTSADFDFAAAEEAEKQALAQYQTLVTRGLPSAGLMIYMLFDAFPVLQCAFILLAGCVTLWDRKPRIRRYAKIYTAVLLLMIIASDLYALLFDPSLYYFDAVSYLLGVLYFFILWKDPKNLVISNIRYEDLCRSFFDALEKNKIACKYNEGKAAASLDAEEAAILINGAPESQLFEIAYRNPKKFPKLDEVLKDAAESIRTKRLAGAPKQVLFNLVWGSIALASQLPRIFYFMLAGIAQNL